MFNRIPTIMLASVVVVYFVTSDSLQAETIADLTSDFSSSVNPNALPNGTWSFNAGSTPLTYANNWAGLNGLSGWAPAANVNGNFLPFWGFVTPTEASNAGLQVQSGGSVVVHSTDVFNGSGNGLANVTWTSNVSALASISMELWAPRQFGRENSYDLFLIHGASSTTLASGNIPEDNSNSPTNPISISISNLQLTSGDVVEFEVTTLSPIGGDFTGVDLTISGTPSAVPEPSTFALLTLGGIGLICCASRRRRTAAGR